MPSPYGRQDLRADPTVEACLSRHAAAEPGRPIIVERGRQISRADLQRQAIAIAARLGQAGIGPDRTVAVCLPRSTAQIAASLAIMKVGSACLPLSPSDPIETLRFKLADCDVALLIVEDGDDPRLAAAPGIPVMTVETAGAGSAAAPGLDAVDPLDARRVAWICPASGGGPATCGVELTHANMLFLSAWLHAECGIGPGDRMCHMADPGASTTMLEVWPALLAGATVVIMDEAVAADPRRITAWLAAERIDALVAGEKAMDALADSPIRADAALRLVMTDLEQARRYPADPHFRLVATYGPEECGLVCSAHPVARNERPGGPHIGRPIAGAAIHILDESGRKVSAGEEGEMWIGGPGVGRGYRNRPDLTAERFVPDPFGDDPAGMIFRTGRRGRAFIGGVIGRSVPDRHGERRVGTH